METIEIPKPSVESAGVSGRFLWITENLGSHVREYGSTFATEFTVLACQLLTYKLAAHFLGKTGFAEYAVARRTISILYPIVLLGLGVGLPRYVAIAAGRGDEESKARYLGATLWCVGAAALACVVLLNAFPGGLAYLFFGSREYASLILPLSLVVAGLAVHAIVYSYFRGMLEMRAANLLQFLNLGLVPLAAFAFYSKSVQSVLTALGILSLAVAGAGLLFTPWKMAAKDNRAHVKELLRFGIQRVPGDFLHMALFTLPVTFVAHFSGMQEAGYVAFGVSVLNMIGSIFQPLGLVLLPKASRMLAGGDLKELREHVAQVVKATVLVSVSVAVVLEFSAGQLIRVYLGANFSEAASVLRILVLAGVPYSLYCVLRNLVDAFHENAVNTRNLLVAFAVFLVFSLASLLVIRPPVQILGAFVLSVLLVAVLSCVEALKIVRFGLPEAR